MEENKFEKGIDWVESSFLSGIDLEFKSTFSPEKDSDLQFKWLQRDGALATDSHLFVQRIFSVEHLKTAYERSDACQIFCIRQKHSYARLYVSRALFDQLLSRYSVFTRFWDFILPFSFKTRESDLVNAPFRFRQLEPTFKSDAELGSFECAYGFRYVELNHRTLAKRENPDYDPWSVRQSAVYQQYDSKHKRVMFILVAPSETARKNLEEAIQRAGRREKPLNAFDLHRIFISTLHENWRQYVRGLERLMMHESDRVTLTQVQNESEKLSPLTDFALNFVDRQRMQMIIDKVLDLVVIFESLYNTLSKLRRQCELHCLKEECDDCVCSSTIEELEEQMHEAQVNLKKVDVLHRRAQGTAQLLSDLLDYENAQIAHLNEQALNGLVKETKDENSKMRILTERSTADAAAVKILTVITLIYLPMTVVANFFSSQLIRVNDSGNISVVSASWWFAVVSVPLTIFTFLVWKWWLSHSIRAAERKQVAEPSHEENSVGWVVKSVPSWSSAWKYVSDARGHQKGRLPDNSVGA